MGDRVLASLQTKNSLSSSFLLSCVISFCRNLSQVCGALFFFTHISEGVLLNKTKNKSRNHVRKGKNKFCPFEKDTFASKTKRAGAVADAQKKAKATDLETRSQSDKLYEPSGQLEKTDITAKKFQTNIKDSMFKLNSMGL